MALCAVHSGVSLGEREAGVVKIGRCPSWCSGVAKHAVGGESGRLVGRIGGCQVILLVTGIAIGGCTGEAASSMTLVAILDIVSCIEWKGKVRETLSGPGVSHHGMTVRALRAQVPFHMVGICRSLVVGHVAINAFHTQGFEAERGCRRMAAATFGHIMGTQKREAPLPVNVGDIIDNPGMGGMASVAVVPNGLLVHVCMTQETFRFRF